MNTIYNRSKDTDYESLIKEVYNDNVLRVMPLGISYEDYFKYLYCIKRVLNFYDIMITEDVYRELSYFYFNEDIVEKHIIGHKLVNNEVKYRLIFEILNNYTRDSMDRYNEVLFHYYVTEEDHYTIKHIIEVFIYYDSPYYSQDIELYIDSGLEITDDIKEYTKTVVNKKQPSKEVKNKLRELGYLEYLF